MPENAQKNESEKKPPEQPKEKKTPLHPVAKAIDRLVHRARDVKVAARQFLPIAEKSRRERFEKIEQIITENAPLLEDPDSHKRVLAQKEVYETLVRFHRLRRSRVPQTLEGGLFLGLFSAFDAFTGDLLRGLYSRKPGLFGSLNKTVSFEEVMTAKSLDALKMQVLDDDIESLRRKSYVDQFSALAQRFDVKLTAFDRWPQFVECSQRRNLLTHCDGIVTEQYLGVCREAGVDTSSLPKIGSRVRLGPDYFFASCELVMEVGIKLGQTLWRKTLPEELKEADSHLMRTLYEALETRNWARARMTGEFAYAQRKLSSDLNRKIIIINYAQALKRDGKVGDAKRILGEVDWSAAANDFKLARSILLEDYVEASELMRKIGVEGELLEETSYHTWPLFLEFRGTDLFASAYLDVFGHPYTSKLREDASEVSQRAGEEAQKKPFEEISTAEEAMPPQAEAENEGTSSLGSTGSGTDSGGN